MDALESLTDEVALEGLDGITLTSLWCRLETRNPPFPLLLDTATKHFLWRALQCNHEIEIFELPEERPPLFFHDSAADVFRYEEIDIETGILETKRDPAPLFDIYPIHMVQDNKDGLQGSCRFFNERVNICNQVRTESFQPLCTYEEAMERWGDKLVVVASQMLRYRALISWEGDPEVKLPDYSYCILERLGRARWQGELQRDLHSGAFKVDAGKMHYHRRVLDANGLITLQSHVIRLPNGVQQYTILLLLKRFHVDRRTKYDILMERISTVLASRPNQMEVLISLREHLGLCERTFKRLYQYMIAAGTGKVVTLPLHEINREGRPCKTKKGTDIMVRCLKLLKPYKRKHMDDDDDDDEEENSKTIVPVDIIYERDMLTQAYELVASKGPKGMSQTEIRCSMNVGKLEARMLCRLLERYKVVKGLMEDEGRQRTTKYIAHIFVEDSELNRQLEKEKARSEQLATDSFVSAEPLPEERFYIVQSTPAPPLPIDEEAVDASYSESEEDEEYKPKRKRKRKLKVNAAALLNKSKLKKSPFQSTPQKGKKISSPKRLVIRKHSASDLPEEPEEYSGILTETESSSDAFPSNSNIFSCPTEEEITVIEEVRMEKPKEKPSNNKRRNSRQYPPADRPHETYRLLKRKNMIVEAVRNLKLIESLFTLQKMVMDQEKQEGVSTKCCRKSILRLVHKLSQEGLLRLYRTIVIQDGISRKVEFVVHPSVLPTDPLVKSAIEQVRFRISSSYTAHRLKVAQAQAQALAHQAQVESECENLFKDDCSFSGEKNEKSSHQSENRLTNKTDEKMGITPLKNYKPAIVAGLGRSRGFLPKLPRLRLLHIFLFYIIYGHPMRKRQCKTKKTPVINSDGGQEEGNTESNTGTYTQDNATDTEQNEEDSLLSTEAEQIFSTEMEFVNEVSWKKWVPPCLIHKEFGFGWALVSDILLCLPLSIFIQIIQVSYKVDCLDEFLTDPLKKHTLIRYLPTPMRQQLLYKRKYIFSVIENLHRLCFMGLVQFGPTEKYQDKDQVFIYLKRNATVVDTSTCEPHYNLARSSRPFDKRFYHFGTVQDVEHFWFDLQWVCLNTPLGIVRGNRRKNNRQKTQQDGDETEVTEAMEAETEVNKHKLERNCALLEYSKGSREVVDDGSIPGDGMGAAGVDSGFFGHLKRNWIWTSYIINRNKQGDAPSEPVSTVRLHTFLNKHSLPMSSGNRFNLSEEANSAGDFILRKDEDIQMQQERLSDRRNQVIGGKNQKRKRPKNETTKKEKTKKKKVKTVQEIKKRRPKFHDETDKNALERMTRRRVMWTTQEDGLLMLCRIASSVLNKKVKGPFVSWQVVRDIMHSNFEECLDKTSHAVGRRSRYIIKNPQTYLNYRVCLAEVYQDKQLIEEFLSRKSDYQNPKICAEEYKELVERLRKKFSSTLGDPNLEIPDTVQELFKRFRVLAIGEETTEEMKVDKVECIEDIHIIVLHNLIQSTLALSDTQMKVCQSLQTFHLYREFRDDILMEAFQEWQKLCLVNRRRGNASLAVKKNRALPFAPMSYQLSQSYYKLFTWRFPNTICSESYQFLKKVVETGMEDCVNTFSFQNQEPVTNSEMISYPVEGSGGTCIATLSLLMLGLLSVDVRIPEQIVVVDSTLVDNEIIKSLTKEGLDDDDEDDEDDEEGSSKRKIEVKARQASHTNYLLMKGFYVPGIVSIRNINSTDNIVVNSCQVKIKLRCTPARSHFSSSDAPYFPNSIIPPSFTRFIKINRQIYNLDNFKEHCISLRGYNSCDLSAVLEIRNAIEEYSYFGMEEAMLSRQFCNLEKHDSTRTRSLKHYIQDLVDLEQVLRVGSNTVRYVALIYAKPWLLHYVNLRYSTKHFFKEYILNSEGQASSSAQNQEVEVAQDNPAESLVSSMETPLSSVIERERSSSQSVEAEQVDSDQSVIDIEQTVKQSHEDIDSESESRRPPKKKVLQGQGLPTSPRTLSCDSDVALQSVLKRTEICDQLEPETSDKLQDKGQDSQQQSLLEETESFSEKDSQENTSSTDASLKDSILPSSDRTDVPETVFFISRPWRMVDGQLNRPVCKGMMEAVLYHIMTKPGVTELSLLKHYSCVLQPSAVLELLEALEKFGCVTKHYIQKTAKVSLFSSTTYGEENRNPEKNENCSAFYEPTVDCTLKLGKVFPSEQNWNKWVQFIHS
ncbi:general transcription factor 3C polypeptide 1 [Protopterus annectens]|uniref:general transcription factor 3C polypeptide 1 n=1 Tax=Protopterus annectens TaxID=7888 RepID=UPI001CF9B5F0|nr:general transcription factor 3C polypeptide 1 [Protopterus annectens]